MEYLNEAVILSVDWLILGLCLKEYYSYKHTVKSLKVKVEKHNLKNKNKN